MRAIAARATLKWPISTQKANISYREKHDTAQNSKLRTKYYFGHGKKVGDPK